MSTRKKAKVDTAQADVDAGDSGLGGADSFDATLTTVQGDTVRRNARGNRGILKEMLTVSLDILMEIFTFMHPRDLLNLARTSKPFRAFLMSRSARSVWRASMERIEGLPKCPSYMAEPAFVNLLFFSHCHNCLKSNVQTVIFPLSARYCSPCKHELLMRSGYADLLDEIRSVSGQVNPFNLSFDGNVVKREVDDFRKRWNALSDIQAKRALAAQYMEKKKLVEEATRDFTAWKDAEKAKRRVELKDRRAERLNSIQDRLRAEGWADELAHMTLLEQLTFKNEKFASKAELLTEKGWQKIRGDVTSFMEKVKARQLEDERKAVLFGRFDVFAKAYHAYRGPKTQRDYDSDINPHLPDLAMMDEFRAILDVPEGSDLSVLDDADVMRAKFEAAIPKWREERKNELTAMVRATLTIPDDVEDPLQLVTALFLCTCCRRDGMTYPDVVSHPCLRINNHCTDIYSRAVKRNWYPTSIQSAWGSRYLQVSTHAVSVMKSILDTCRLDQDRTILSDMASCQARVVCKSCSTCSMSAFDCSPDGKVTKEDHWRSFHVYDYHDALAHALDKRRYTKLHKWERITEKEWEVVKKVEDEMHDKPWLVDLEDSLHGCNHCHRAAKLPRLRAHIKKRHNVDVDENNDYLHCYLHRDAQYQWPDVSLERHDDGTVKAKYYERNALLNFPSLFSFGEPEEAEYPFWDSDEGF